MKTSILITCMVILSTTSIAQTTWYEIPTGTDHQLNTIHFPTPQTGYIGGNDSLLLKSTDYGQTWTQLNFSGVTFNLGGEDILNLQFITESIGYMALGPYGGTYKTIDGGLTWTQITPAGNLCFNEGLYFFDEQNGFLGGSGCFQGELIEKMTSGTLATTTINSSSWSSDNRVVDIDFLNNNFGLAASVGGRILRTTDGGSNWDTIPSSLPVGTPVTAISIVNDTLAYASYDDLSLGFGLLISTDAGLTWEIDMNSATFYYPDLYAVHTTGEGHVYSGGVSSSVTGGIIFESTSFGSWMFYTVDQTIFDITSYGDTVVFAVGDSGYVVTNVQPGNLALDDNMQEKTLMEVFPNPVQKEINLLFNFTQPENATVIIYDLSGQVVYEEILNGTTLPVDFLNSGVYLIQVSTPELILSPIRIIKE